jgi:protein-tyrosine-phosphatase
MNPRLLLKLSLLLGLLVVAETSLSGRSEPPSTILFLCPYGGAKSVIAASYFNRLAIQRGLPVSGVAAATEEPYDRVPPAVATDLALDGIDVSRFRPRRVAKEDLSRALRVVAIDCDLTKTDTTPLVAERWDDVPKVSEDLPGATAAIRRHVQKLVQELAEPQSSRYTTADADEQAWLSSSVRTCIPP